MKRGQLLGIPFVYILALVTAAFILIFGVRLIFQLQETAESVEISNFINNLRDETEKYYYLDEGSSRNIKVDLPNKVEYICFRGSDGSDDLAGDQKFGLINTLDPTKSKQVFIIPFDSYDNTIFNIKNLGDPNQKDNVLCFKNGDDFRIMSKRDFVQPMLPP